MSRTALMIAYFFPPLGKGGVQRMSKLAKYLPQFGYRVKILTVKPIRYPAHDRTLLDELPEEVEIFRCGSKDPARILRFFPFTINPGRSLKDAAKNKGGFWPDAKIGWKNPAVKLGRKIIEAEKIDLIISSSPPVTGHLVAMELAEKYQLPWVADFRDVWESRPPEELYRDRELIDRSVALMHEIGHKSDAVTAINEIIAGRISSTGKVIGGGFDPDDFENLRASNSKDKFMFGYLGTVEELHPIEPFFEAAQIAAEKNNDFSDKVCFRIIGANNRKNILRRALKYKLEARVEVVEYLPHRQSLEKAAAADVMLLSVPEGYPDIMTGKIFDLMGFAAPVLASVPIPGEAHKLINGYQGGICVRPDQPEELAEKMLLLFNNRCDGIVWQKRDLKLLTRFEVARRFAEIFDNLTGVRPTE